MIYVVDAITGGGWDKDPIGFFSDEQKAIAAVLDRLSGHGFEFDKYSERLREAGQYRTVFVVKNKPYFLQVRITPIDMNRISNGIF